MEAAKTEPIAIVGMSCRFPGAHNLEQFWDLLISGQDPIKQVPEERWNVDEFYDANPAIPGKIVTRLGGFIEDVDKFDASFFSIAPKEAETLDPQQRLLMELTWEALEHAGITPGKLRGSKTSIFVGVSSSDYALLIDRYGLAQDIDLFQVAGKLLGGGAGRLANFLGVTGESVAIDTFTSSSLVALHHACLNLREGEAPLSIVAGVNLILSPVNSISFSSAHILAKDGHCKTFDSAADGICRSEGGGVVILKRLKDAIRDKNKILAVIKSTNINQDGDTSNFRAPSQTAQTALINEALLGAALKPGEINYIEAHGTGTPLGDLIETQALKEVFGNDPNRNEALLVGSVKSNIGHLEAAAGIAGLIKVVASLQHQLIPVNLHLKQLNPKLPFEAIPAKVIVDTPYPWLTSHEHLRRAGVTSIGFMGTNAHAILEEAPQTEKKKTIHTRPWHLLPLSAKNESALEDLIVLYQKHLQSHPEQALAEIAHTATGGREHFENRLVCIAKTNAELLAKLQKGDYLTGKARPIPPKIAFFFTGQGSQYPQLGKQLYETQTVFKEAFDRCSKNETFAFEYALAELWKSWGIIPDYVIGQGIGESVAATISGSLTLEEGLKSISDPLFNPDKFNEKIKQLQMKGCEVFLEIGMGMERESLPEGFKTWLPSLKQEQEVWLTILDSLAQLYLLGLPINWDGFDMPYHLNQVDLPTYPFQRQSYWFETLAEPKRLLKKTESPLLQQLQKAIPSQRKEILNAYLRQLTQTLLKFPSQQDLKDEQGFVASGMDSLLATQFRNTLQEELGNDYTLPTTLAFDYPSIAAIMRYFENSIFPLIGIQTEKTKQKKRTKIKEGEPIAVIGIGCRFPGGANHPERFWQLLEQGFDGISEIPKERWNADSYFDKDPDVPGKMYTRRGGFLTIPVDQFDPLFFGISPREAELMDPQQRLLLEVAWEALEDAGIDPTSLAGTQSGVFMGVSFHDYENLLSKYASTDDINAYFSTGNAPSVLSGRLSYCLGLQGPSMSIDTACSSSLTALHEACKSLKEGESDLTLVGGVNLILSPDLTINFCKAHMLAKDGYCKTFDVSADGYTRGEGCGVIVLKRLLDAQQNNDRILGVIRATSVNQDGATSGLTVPNGEAQSNLIKEALQQANLTPDAIDYIEAHGTGTSLGDPIEVNAIGSIFSNRRDNPLLLGSVKTNIGHLESAAGIAGMIKVLLSLQHDAIPPHLHFNTLNPHIDLNKIPAMIPLTLTSWQRGKRPRLAGISSFGYSGTNAHAIIEDAPLQTNLKKSFDRPLHLLTLSAKTEAALKEMIPIYRQFLSNTREELVDIAYTANTGRAHFENRVALIGNSKEEMVLKLQNQPIHTLAKLPKLVFLFDGHTPFDTQLYENQPAFKEAFDLCSSNKLFAFGYALAALLKSWGIIPDYVLGKGVGEFIGATVAGILSVEDGLKAASNHFENIACLPPQLGFISSFTGKLAGSEGISPEIWIKNSSDHFEEGIKLVKSFLQVNIDSLNEWPTLLEKLRELYLSGVAIDWKVFDSSYHRKKIPLPTYPFQRQSYWAKAITRSQKPIKNRVHPLLGECITSSLLKEKEFENLLDLGFLPYLEDHQVYNHIIFPAAAYVETFIAAGNQIYDHPQMVLESLVIEKPLILSHNTPLLTQLIAEPEGEEGYHLTLYSTNTQQHASVRIHPTKENTPVSLVDWEQLCSSHENSISIPDFYQKLAKWGLQYGKEFQPIRELKTHQNEVIAELQRGQDIHCLLDPRLLDGCLQAFFAAISHEAVYLPVSIDQLTLFSPLSQTIRMHGKLTQQTESGFIADFNLFSLEGQILAQVKGLHMRKADQVHLLHMLERDEVDCYELIWQQKSLQPINKELGGKWIIFSENDPFTAQLKEQKCQWIDVKNAPTKEEILNLLKQYEPFTGILHIFGSLKQALQLSQAVVLLNSIEKPLLCFITEGSEGVDSMPNLSQAPLNGFYKTLRQEYPELRLRHIDLDPQANTKQNIDHLLNELVQQEDNEDQVAYIKGMRYVPRLTRLKEGKKKEQLTVPASKVFQLDTDSKGSLDSST